MLSKQHIESKVFERSRNTATVLSQIKINKLNESIINLISFQPFKTLDFHNKISIKDLPFSRATKTIVKPFFITE